MRDYKYPAVFPGEDKALLEQARDVSGLSLNQIIVKGAMEEAGRIVAESKAGRVTNVDPLPAKELREMYSRPEMDDASLDRAIAAQAQGVGD